MVSIFEPNYFHVNIIFIKLFFLNRQRQGAVFCTHSQEAGRQQEVAE